MINQSIIEITVCQEHEPPNTSEKRGKTHVLLKDSQLMLHDVPIVFFVEENNHTI
jgi:hypothetical protein